MLSLVIPNMEIRKIFTGQIMKQLSSNRESGDGYSDIQVEIEDEEIGIVIEVKYAHDADLEVECRKALKQIGAAGYTEQLREEGMRTILKYGIACFKKRCKVMLEKDL